MSNIDRPIETQLFIDGELCKASDAGTYPIYNQELKNSIIFPHITDRWKYNAEKVFRNQENLCPVP